MSENFKKVLRIGTHPYYSGVQTTIFVEIEYKDGRLSITGTHGGSGGQIQGDFAHRNTAHNDTDTPIKPEDITFSDGWTAEMWLDLLDVWERWHLNDLKAGSPAQEAYLRAHRSEWDGKDYYTWARQTLATAGLQPDPNYIHNGKPYSYGSAWLTEEVPADVVRWLEDLPDTKTSGASAYDLMTQDFLTKFGITLTLSDKKDTGRVFQYTVTLRRTKRNGEEITWQFPFWGSMNDHDNKKDPTAYDVLANISGGQRFWSKRAIIQEFGSDAYNMDMDAIIEQANSMNRFFTEAALEELDNIN